jgi:carbamate kinase
VCAGGGGIPVIVDSAGARHGVEAVVDKDFASALLARQLSADLLLLLTDVPAIELEWRTPQARPVGRITATELQQHRFEAGTMAPKVDAATWFVRSTRHRAAVGALADAHDIVAGTAGTSVVDGA